MNPLIYGKDKTDRIVCIEPGDSEAVVYRELEDGRIVKSSVPCSHYILFTERHSPKFKRLKGDQVYRYLWETDSTDKWNTILNNARKRRQDHYVIRDPKEALMVKDGLTYFKEMKIEDVSVLSFDLETTGVKHNKDSKILLISNTFRKLGKIERKLFSIDEFDSQGDMLLAWCKWVRVQNPSVVLGHNIFGFDLPYLQYVAKQSGVSLRLGRDKSPIKFASRGSLFRKDGSQTYDYFNAWIYGREIVDTYFLAMKYDIKRKYESYGLKQIIKQEKLERKGRQHYDAGQIAKNWHNPEERKKIKAYAIDDADDALKLYDLMIPSLFYYTQSVPRTFQSIINSATGSQVNSLMVRGYLQRGYSIAKGSPAVEYEGAISFGNPGIHKNVLRFDVASLYPSIMRQYKIYSKKKDPKGLFLKIVETFTVERLKNKQLGKDTGDRYYKDMEQAQKIVINSAYGFLGAPKLNYNSPKGAAAVTRHGRRILTESMDFITKDKELVLVAGDTDGLAFKKPTQKPFTSEERSELVNELNSRMDELIRWEDDGTYKRQIVVKTKNYILQNEKNEVEIKGSGLKATTKEKALQKFIQELIELLLKDKKSQVLFLYLRYVRAILNLTDITEWCSKKTLTKAVLKPTRTTERKILDTLKGTTYTEGDKFYVFNKSKDELCLRENFTGEYDKNALLRKLHDTLSVFSTVIDTDLVPDFTLKRNEELLNEIFRD